MEILQLFDSDHFLINISPSLLRNTNNDGVFAKVDISFGAIICEYRGPIIADKDRLAYVVSNPKTKMMATYGLDGEIYHIIGRNICADIQDCTSTSNKPYTNQNVRDASESRCHDGFSYNARLTSLDQSGALL